MLLCARDFLVVHFSSFQRHLHLLRVMNNKYGIQSHPILAANLVYPIYLTPPDRPVFA